MLMQRMRSVMDHAMKKRAEYHTVRILRRLDPHTLKDVGLDGYVASFGRR